MTDLLEFVYNFEKKFLATFATFPLSKFGGFVTIFCAYFDFSLIFKGFNIRHFQVSFVLQVIFPSEHLWLLYILEVTSIVFKSLFMPSNSSLYASVVLFILLFY